MLRTRVMTALALLFVVLPSLFYLAPLPWLVAVLVVLMVAAWEWSRLSSFSGLAVWGFVTLTGGAFGAISLFLPQLMRGWYGVAFLFWLIAVPWMFLSTARPRGWLAALAGWCVLLPFAAALVDLRGMGPWLLLSVMALVWIADIAAYFAGRAFGRNKLAPTISPGKTWEGVIGAMVGVSVYVVANYELGNPLLARSSGWLPAIAAAVLLTFFSVIGDLFESAMKRAAGMKDSSQLLPGHGGVMDRVDSLTSTLPVAALLLIWNGAL